MRLYYEGKDITERVLIESALYTDCAGGGCDTLEITLSDADAWDGWRVQRGDVIRCEKDGFDTGDMYLDSYTPEDGKYKLIAASIPQRARRKAWKSYEDISLRALMDEISAEAGMGFALWGVNEEIRYAYLTRRRESGSAFLDRILCREGAVLKCVGGRMCAIGIEWAQERAAARTMNISAGMDGIYHISRTGKKLSELRAFSYKCGATAFDADMSAHESDEIELAEADSEISAARWARGLLLKCNRSAEKLKLNTEFDGKLTAMARVDITGGSRSDGRWIVDRAVHDFVNGHSSATMLRCVETIR